MDDLNNQKLLDLYRQMQEARGETPTDNTSPLDVTPVQDTNKLDVEPIGANPPSTSGPLQVEPLDEEENNQSSTPSAASDTIGNEERRYTNLDMSPGDTVTSKLPKDYDPELDDEMEESPSEASAKDISKGPKELPEDLDKGGESLSDGTTNLNQGQSPSASSLLQMLSDNRRNYGDQLRDAQDQQREAILNARLLQAGDLIGSGIAGLGGKIPIKPVIQEAMEQQIKDAGLPVQQLEQRIANEKNDPASQLSNTMREYFKQLTGQDISQNISASDITQVAPLFKEKETEEIKKLTIQSNLQNKQLLNQLASQKLEEQARYHQETAADRRDANKSRSDLAQELREGRASDKQDTSDTARLDKVNKLITAEMQSRSPFGKAALNKQAVQNAKALMEGRDLNDLDNREVAEVARVLDRVLSQAAPTYSGAKELTPETGRKELARIEEFLGNSRQGAGASSFLNQFQKTFQREEDLANKQMGTVQKQLLSPYSDLKDDPRMQNILDSRGLSNVWDYGKDNKPSDKNPSQTNNQTPTSQQVPSGPTQHILPKEALPPLAPNEVRHITHDGTNRSVIFDKNTKQFLRYE